MGNLIDFKLIDIKIENDLINCLNALKQHVALNAIHNEQIWEEAQKFFPKFLKNKESEQILRIWARNKQNFSTYQADYPEVDGYSPEIMMLLDKFEDMVLNYINDLPVLDIEKINNFIKKEIENNSEEFKQYILEEKITSNLLDMITDFVPEFHHHEDVEILRVWAENHPDYEFYRDSYIEENIPYMILLEETVKFNQNFIEKIENKEQNHE